MEYKPEDELGKLFAKLMEENFPQHVLLLLLVTEKVKDYGIKLTRTQRQILTLHFQTSGIEGLDGLKVELNSRQKAQLKKLGHKDNDVVLSIDDIDLDNLRSKIDDMFSTASESALDYLSKKLLKSWKAQSKPMLRIQKNNRQIFNNYVNKNWGKPLDLLEALISVSLEAGQDFHEKFGPIAVQENNIVFDVLTRLHARGCQVSSEILILLRNGLADGAHARWRTLHEICVEAQFIALYGNDVALKYTKHWAIAEYERAKIYQKHSSEINYQPLSSEEFDFIKSQRDEAINLFGSDFDQDNGWAYQALGKKDNKKEKVRFSEIEEKAGLTHIRPFYKLANVNVHSGSIGTIFRLGSPPNKDLLVAGSSIYGLAEPGQNTAYSINLLTNTLLAVDESSLENVGFMLTARKLMNEVVWVFDEVVAKSKDF